MNLYSIRLFMGGSIKNIRGFGKLHKRTYGIPTIHWETK